MNEALNYLIQLYCELFLSQTGWSDSRLSLCQLILRCQKKVFDQLVCLSILHFKFTVAAIKNTHVLLQEVASC